MISGGFGESVLEGALVDRWRESNELDRAGRGRVPPLVPKVVPPNGDPNVEP
jgi:hypothetical protein